MISLINYDSSEGEQWGRYNLPRRMGLIDIYHPILRGFLSVLSHTSNLEPEPLCWSLNPWRPQNLMVNHHIFHKHMAISMKLSLLMCIHIHLICFVSTWDKHIKAIFGKLRVDQGSQKKNSIPRIVYSPMAGTTENNELKKKTCACLNPHLSESTTAVQFLFCCDNHSKSFSSNLRVYWF